jgi:hypothetical protein
MKRIAIRALSVLLASAAAAHAGVYIESVEKDTRTGKAGETHRFWAQGGNARVEAGATTTLLKGEAMVVVDAKQKSYFALDRAALKQIAGRMNAMRGQMNAQMAGLPPEQRAMVERMMGGGGMTPATAPKIETVDTRRGEKVDGRACRVWDVKLDGQVVQQHCVVPFGALPGKEDLRAIIDRMAALTEELRQAMPQMEASLQGVAGGMNGYPVLTRYYERGRPSGRERRVSAWREESVAADKFEVPAGYEQRDLAAEMNRGMR